MEPGRARRRGNSVKAAAICTRVAALARDTTAVVPVALEAAAMRAKARRTTQAAVAAGKAATAALES